MVSSWHDARQMRLYDVRQAKAWTTYLRQAALKTSWWLFAIGLIKDYIIGFPCLDHSEG
jgi:hypothetical protein